MSLLPLFQPLLLPRVCFSFNPFFLYAHLPPTPTHTASYFYSILFADTLDSVKDVLGKWGKKAAEATKKAEDLAGNMWQHCMYYYYFHIYTSGKINFVTKP